MQTDKTSAPSPKYPKANDELSRLFLATQDSSERARSSFFHVFRRRLYVLVAQELKRSRYFLLASDIDDVVQELLIEAWQVDLVRYDPDRGSLVNFMRRKVRWRVVEAVRRVARERARTVVDGEELDPAELLEEATGEDSDDDRELEALDELAGLDEPARTTIERHDLGGERLKDIAKEMNLHPSSVTRLRQKGLRELRSRLNGGPRPGAPSAPRSSRDR